MSIKDKAYIVGIYEHPTRLATDKTVTAPDNVDGITVNNRLRSVVDGALSGLKLFSKEREQRLAGALELQKSPDSSQTPLIAKALAKEADPQIKSILELVAATANLQDLIGSLAPTGRELGLAFDGDGDRLGVVTSDGCIIYPDRQLMLFAADLLARNPGATVIYDVKSTRNLKPWIARHGGTPLLWKTGHSLIKAKMKQSGALLAGEMSGHTFFKERWYGFDDGLYAGARLLEILSRHADPSAALHALPDSISTPELNVTSSGEPPHALIARLAETAEFPGATEVIRLDGLRVEYPDGFGLARASNTTPVVVFRFEADNEAALKRIQAEFRRVLAAHAPDLALPF